LMGEIGGLLIEARTENRKHRNYWDFNARTDTNYKVAQLRLKYEAKKAEVEREMRAARAQHDPVFLKSVMDHLADCDQEFGSESGQALPPMGADE
jgi:hypothetical protein